MDPWWESIFFFAALPCSIPNRCRPAWIHAKKKKIEAHLRKLKEKKAGNKEVSQKRKHEDSEDEKMKKKKGYLQC